MAEQSSRGFYRRLAWTNIRRNRVFCLPFALAVAVVSAVFFLCVGIAFSDGLSNMPSGATARAIFAFGVFTFALFAFFFMFYLNHFLVKQRKKEFGLYAVLGLSKNHVGRILLWENFLLIGGGMLSGILLGALFGQLLFSLLKQLIHAAPGLQLRIPPVAYLGVAILFALVFAATAVYNLAQIRLANPISLLQSEKRGEKKSRFLLPAALLGLAMLGFAYYFAWTIENYAIALGVFFPLAMLVICATYLLFAAGSIAVLRLLRANKRFYYRPEHFVSISGMFHRMKQNAAGLATICILSTMLTVTLTTTLSLYLGQEKILAERYPQDLAIYSGGAEGADAAVYDAELSDLAALYDITLRPAETEPEAISVLETLPHSLYDAQNNWFYCDISGADADATAFIQELRKGKDPLVYGYFDDVFSARQEGYTMFGGLLFLGAFFSIVFLVIAVLLIYFKQVSEGYEDKARYLILQQVGMDAQQVQDTIRRQVRWVFILPLLATMLHMLFASRIITRMLEAFLLYDWGMTLRCSLGVCLLFILLYFVVYQLTARIYYRIVRHSV